MEQTDKISDYHIALYLVYQSSGIEEALQVYAANRDGLISL